MTGEYQWQIPLGEAEALKSKGVKNTGTENYGGPLVTTGGLIIIAAVKYSKSRALASPQVNCCGNIFCRQPVSQHGKQYIVIACGGTKLYTPKRR
ncbi:hypothetical protein [Niabella aquatica]